MNNKVLDATYAKCDSCGSGVFFSPKDQDLKCEHCQSVKHFEKSRDYLKHDISQKPSSLEGYEKWKTENKVLRCETCGAEIVLSGLEYSGTCPYCGSSVVSKTDKLPGMTPDAVIPFKFNEEDAGKIFAQRVKKKFFVPRAFKKKINPDKVKGIYVPAFSFDAKTLTAYKGTLAKSYSNGKQTTTETFYISGKKELFIKDELVETSSKITQEQLKKILPYNSNESFRFDENFIRGYVVEHFETAFDQCYKQAKEAMYQKIKREILNGYNYDYVVSFEMDSKFSEEKYAYRLVPVYQFEYKYKNKPYITQMNGQTGKIGGGLPISPWRVFLVVLLVLAFIAGVTALTLLTD